jgi:hypothetical protein
MALLRPWPLAVVAVVVADNTVLVDPIKEHRAMPALPTVGMDREKVEATVLEVVAVAVAKMVVQAGQPMVVMMEHILAKMEHLLHPAAVLYPALQMVGAIIAPVALEL